MHTNPHGTALFVWCCGLLATFFEAAAANSRSVLFSQHDGDVALGDRRISWVGRVSSESLVKIIDLEKDRLAIDLKRPKVVLLIWVIGVTEIVVDSDRLNDATDGFGAEGRDTGGDEGRTDSEVLAQSVVERAVRRQMI